MSPGDRVYLDMKYQEDYPLGLAWAGTVEVADTWGWDPDRYLDGVEPERVRGVEAAVWTETLTTREELFTMLLPRLPAAAVSIPDADLLERLAKSGRPVRVRFRLECGDRGEAESANVIGEIPGRGKPDEIVLLGAHLDSWDLGTGAIGGIFARA